MAEREYDRVAEVLDKIRMPAERDGKNEICILSQEKPSVWKILPAVNLALAFADSSSLTDKCRLDIILWVRNLKFQIDKANTFSTDVKDWEKLLQYKRAIQ